MHRRALLALIALAAAACGDDDEPLSPTDAGQQVGADAEVPDMETVDMGPPDMGPVDVGPEPCPMLGTPLGEGIAPDARDDMAVAVDEGCGRVFMAFGDQAVPEACGFPPAEFNGEIYIFDGRREAWFQLSPATGPGPIERDRAGAVWDPATERLVIFGGRWRAGTRGPYTYPTDVWAFDPADGTWEELHDGEGGPEGRMDFVMVPAADGSGFIISHGGRFAPNFISFEVLDDTWRFDFATQAWTQVSTTGFPPPPSVYPAGVLDVVRGELWVFSGSGANAFLEPPDLHMGVLDLETGAWTLLNPDRASWPKARFNAAMVYDEGRDRLLLFGGHDNTALGNDNDLLEFDLETRTWQQLREGDTQNASAIDMCTFPGNFTNADLDSPERRAAHLFAVLDGGRAVTYGGNTDCGLANDTWWLDLETDSWSQLTASPTGMTCPRTGNPSCDDPGTQICD